MGPISRVNARPIDPYLQWRERMEEKKAEKEKYAGSQDLKTSKAASLQARRKPVLVLSNKFKPA